MHAAYVQAFSTTVYHFGFERCPNPLVELSGDLPGGFPNRLPQCPEFQLPTPRIDESVAATVLQAVIPVCQH